MSESEEFDVVWNGAQVDSLGTKGGLTRPYPPHASRSIWYLMVQELSLRRGRPLADILEEAQAEANAR
jgi:hypothetical protein